MAEETLNNELDIIECQFLCGYDSKLVNWNFWRDNLTWNNQKAFYDRTAGHKLNKAQPLKVNYQLAFLNQLLQVITEKSQDVHDEIYEHYCRLMQSKRTPFNHVHYCIPKFNTVISFKELEAFVGHGTTGLCSWEGSLALTNWIVNNPEKLEGKSVIELGAGTGLCGLVASKCCKANDVILTDGSPRVIELMNDNISKNFNWAVVKRVDSSMIIYQYSHEERNLRTLLLPWESIKEHQNSLLRRDVILASDVTYDPECLPSLVEAIEFIFNIASNNCTMFMTATIRNDSTIALFLSLLNAKQFHVEQTDQFGPEQLYWRKDTAITLFTITKAVA